MLAIFIASWSVEWYYFQLCFAQYLVGLEQHIFCVSEYFDLVMKKKVVMDCIFLLTLICLPAADPFLLHVC